MWTWSWAIRNMLAEFLMPPTCWILLGLVTLVLLRNKPKLKVSIISFSFVMIWMTSTILFANWLTSTLDSVMHWPKPINWVEIQKIPKEKQPQAIVILGGGVRHGAIDRPDYQNQDLSKESMERLRYGAMLVKKTNLPILVTGGKPDATTKDQQSEAELMSLVLVNEFNLKAKWVEGTSNTTKENAIQTSHILKREGVQRIYLVSHFWHLPRAQKIFEKTGLQVVPVPMGYENENQFNLSQLTPVDYMPSSSGISRTRQLWHELIGNLWYAVSQ